MYIVLENTERI